LGGSSHSWAEFIKTLGNWADGRIHDTCRAHIFASLFRIYLVFFTEMFRQLRPVAVSSKSREFVLLQPIVGAVQAGIRQQELQLLARHNNNNYYYRYYY